MADPKLRTQILLEPQQHRALSIIARQEKRSMSDILRSIINQYLKERTLDAQRQRAARALERLAVMRAEIEQRGGMYGGDWSADTRAERDAQVGRSSDRDEVPS